MAETVHKKKCALLNPQKTLLFFIIITYFVFLFIVSCFAIRALCPKKTSTPKSINICIVDTKGHRKELSPEGKAYIKEELHTALMEVSGKAEAAYNEKFTILLTALTLFGIAWPLVIAFLQNLSLKEDRKEITKANKRAKETYRNNQYQERKITQLQADFFMQMGSVHFRFADNSGLEIKRRSYTLIAGKEIKQPLKSDKKQVTLVFKTLIDSLESFFWAEKTEPSPLNVEKTSLGYIEMVSTSIFIFAYNYENIDYQSVISDLDKAISEIEQLDNKLSVVKNSLDYLCDSKKQLEQYRLKQLDKTHLS